MALPALVCSPLSREQPDVLPPGKHTGTLDDIRERFVDGPNVPFATERTRLFQVLELYVHRVWDVWPTAELWINGGFVTLKSWAAPSDVDVVIADGLVNLENPAADADIAATLLTADVVRPHGMTPRSGRFQPFGGMIDGFVVSTDLPATVRYWHDTWSTLCDEQKAPVENAVKGYVRLVRL